MILNLIMLKIEWYIYADISFIRQGLSCQFLLSQYKKFLISFIFKFKSPSNSIHTALFKYLKVTYFFLKFYYRWRIIKLLYYKISR